MCSIENRRRRFWLYENIIERRFVDGGHHSMVLEISADEYNQIYDRYNDEIALEIVNNHLQNRSDDGRPGHVRIQRDDNSNIVKIYADIDYLGNDHTIYREHWEVRD